MNNNIVDQVSVASNDPPLAHTTLEVATLAPSNDNKRKREEDESEKQKAKRQKKQTATDDEDYVPSEEEEEEENVTTATSSSSTATTTSTSVTDYSGKTVKELKELCRSRGLKVSGNKTQLIQRLVTGEGAAKRSSSGGSSSKSTGTGRTTPQGVDKRLTAVGIKPEKVSKCLKKGIQLGYVSWAGDDPLSNVVCTEKCEHCNEVVSATVRDVLYQSDYGGDYEDGSDNASFQCPKCEAKHYVTSICRGKPEFDSGKFHNHCTQCKGFGTCIGDYREAHCDRCGKHYFSGLSGFGCPRCDRSDGDSDDEGFGGRGRRGDDCIIS
jgi:hypothetical protein